MERNRLPTECDYNQMNQRIRLNVGGTRHVTYKRVLMKIPATRLSKLSPMLANYDAENDEYFFDRHSTCFTHILNYYRTGKLHYPLDVCGLLFEQELDYWGLDANQVEPCCWKAYTSHRETEEVLNQLDKLDAKEEIDTENYYRRFGWDDEFRLGKLTRWQKIKPQLWAIMDMPNSSSTAKVYRNATVLYGMFINLQIVAAVSLLLLICSTITFCLESVPSLALTTTDSAVINNTTTDDTSSYIAMLPVLRRLLITVQIICNVCFSIDIVLRFITCPKRSRYLLSPLTAIDFVATFTFFADLLFSSIGYNVQTLHMFGMIRVLRLFKLTQHTNGLKILWQTCKASAKEFALLVFFLLLIVIVFATMIFYAEQSGDNIDNDFQSIPKSMWWAVVTVTTLGYGDMYPRTVLGRLVGSICAVCGVLTLALPVPVIVNNFAMFYSLTKARSKMPRTRRKLVHVPRKERIADKYDNRLLSALIVSSVPGFACQEKHSIMTQLMLDDNHHDEKMVIKDDN